MCQEILSFCDFSPNYFLKCEMILGSRGQEKRGDGLDVARGPLFTLPCSRSLWIWVIYLKKKQKKHCTLGVAQRPFSIATSFVRRTSLEGQLFTLSSSGYLLAHWGLAQCTWSHWAGPGHSTARILPALNRLSQVFASTDTRTSINPLLVFIF